MYIYLQIKYIYKNVAVVSLKWHNLQVPILHSHITHIYIYIYTYVFLNKHNVLSNCQAPYIKFIVGFTNLSSIKILSFSVSVYWGKRQSKDKTFWYSSVLNSWYLGQKHRKWISSSTRFKLHISHNRSSAGTLRYLHVSIAKGRTPLDKNISFTLWN